MFVHSTCEETCVGNSRQDKGEVECIVSIVDELVRAWGVHAKLIGIVAPYIALCNLLREKQPEVESIGTVDSFQGQERTIIVVSLVLSDDRSAAGFFSEARRLIVALIRARRSRIVVRDNEFWSRTTDHF